MISFQLLAIAIWNTINVAQLKKIVNIKHNTIVDIMLPHIFEAKTAIIKILDLILISWSDIKSSKKFHTNDCIKVPKSIQRACTIVYSMHSHHNDEQ